MSGVPVLLNEHELVIDMPPRGHRLTQGELSLQDFKRAWAQGDLAILTSLGAILFAPAYADMRDVDLAVRQIAIRVLPRIRNDALRQRRGGSSEHSTETLVVREAMSMKNST